MRNPCLGGWQRNSLTPFNWAILRHLSFRFSHQRQKIWQLIAKGKASCSAQWWLQQYLKGQIEYGFAFTRIIHWSRLRGSAKPLNRGALYIVNYSKRKVFLFIIFCFFSLFEILSHINQRLQLESCQSSSWAPIPIVRTWQSLHPSRCSQ